MVIWAIFYTFVLLLLIKDKKITFVCLLFLTIFTALRYDVGYDYPNYVDLIVNPNSKLIEISDEPISYVLLKISRNIEMPQFYFFVTTLYILLGFFYIAKKNSKDYWISLMMFFSFPLFFFNSLGIIRQWCAIITVLFSLKYVIDKKILKFIIIIIFAIGFHKTAIVALPIYMLNKIKFNYKKIIFVCAFAFLLNKFIILLIEKYFNYYYKFYIATVIKGGGESSFYLCIIFLIFLLIIKKRFYTNEKNILFFNIYFIGCLLYYFSLPYGHVYRISLYYIVISLFIFPEIFLLFNFNFKKNIAYPFYIKICCILFFFTLYLGTKNTIKDPQIPYQNIFSNNGKFK